MRTLLLIPLLLFASASAARSESLAELLAAVEKNARFEAPARADVRIACTPGCQAARAILVGRSDALYVEVQNGQRALVHAGDVRVVADAHAPEAAPDARFADTPLLLRDLAVFTAAALKTPQISDEGPTGVVVTAAPAGPSPYALLVHTIDRDQRTIVKIQYYRESIGRLGKLRRDADWTRVGDASRPGTITVEDFERDTRATLTLAWRAEPDAPAALFEPAGLEKPSGLHWP